jgi:hypothetical protein
MLPLDFDFVWVNVRDSLHIISGCLKRTAEKYTQIGEFHALITLDTEKTKRAIIPEAILIPSTRTNTYLLAHASLLMAGHEFISNLYKPKLKFREGGRIYNDGQERAPNHQAPSHQCRKRDSTPEHTHTQL